MRASVEVRVVIFQKRGAEGGGVLVCRSRCQHRRGKWAECGAI